MHFVFHIFGYIGSFLLMITFFPQVYKTIKTKNAESLSKWFLFLNLNVCICWSVYGVGFLTDDDYINSLTILSANVSIFFCTLILIFCKYKFVNNLISKC